MKLSVKRSIATHTPVLHGGQLSVPNWNPNLVDFSSNICPTGMPASVKFALKKCLGRVENYPDLHSTDLISALRKYTGFPESNLIVGNGAIEIIYNFCNTFLSKKHVLIPIPTFSEYETASKLADCNIKFFKTMDLSENIDLFVHAIPTNGCVFICNPNNPTGKLLSKNKLIKIIRSAKKKSSFVFVDECFIELVPQSNESVLDLIKKYNNLFVLRSLTKSFGLAGIRIGYAITSKHIANILQKAKIPWSVNTLAQIAGITAVKDKSHLTKSKSIIKKEYNFLIKKITCIKEFEYYGSVTNFILIKINQDSTILQKKLLKHNILIRDCKNFRGLGNNFIRIAVKSHKDNLKLIKALEAIT